MGSSSLAGPQESSFRAVSMLAWSLLACYSPRVPETSPSFGDRPRLFNLERVLIIVNVRENEPFEKALRRFRRKVEREGIRKDIKKNSFYLKPGEKRRLKQRLAEKRRRKALRRAARRTRHGR
jgi:small subunit ribosomal protein S21